MSVWLNPRPILDLINEYLEILKNLTEEEFCLQQDNSLWSPSEVYCHIIQVNLRSLLAIEKCIYGKPHQKGYGIPVISRLILYFGRFPPGKINIPQKMVEMVRVITREEAKNDLIKFTAKLKELLPKISKCPSYQRIMHPRLGMLNCSEWLRFIEIYSRYHLKKLKKQISASSRQSG